MLKNQTKLLLEFLNTVLRKSGREQLMAPDAKRARYLEKRVMKFMDECDDLNLH